MGNHTIWPLPTRKRVSISRDVSDCLQYLHSSVKLNRDIKGLNVLLSADGRVKPCDFGLATLCTLTTTTATASGRQALVIYAWCVPEIIVTGAKHNDKSDVSYLGIIK